MVNPFKTVWDYYEKSGVHRELPVMKRMMVEIPHVPLGVAAGVISVAAIYVKLNYFYDSGVGFQERYTVMRPGDPRLAKYRQDVINAEQLYGK